MYENISSNKRNSIILVLLFFIILISLGYFIGFYYGNFYTGIGIGFFAMVFSIIMTLINFYAGDKIILKMSSAKPADKKTHGRLIYAVEGIAIAAGIPTPKIYIIEDSAINAFATGRDLEHASVTVTTGAIERLNKLELESVVAHEISHIKNYDIRLMMLVVILVGMITLLSDWFLRSMFYGKRKNGAKIDGVIGLVFVALGIALIVLSPIIARLIKLAVSRKREFLADANGALLTRYPKGLADALKKIRDDKEPLVEAANKATAHIMFSTHPDINDRIKRLEYM
ncbi:M48 family metallopeptidase [Candidatus Woesearchaeota archaeon]|nr:M48 family metallopeptidase [Candidatus Woesearchaeota archaeon]